MNLILVLILFCIDYYAIYYNTIKHDKDLSEKQRAYILSVKASITLFILSLYFNYKFIKNNNDIDIYSDNINVNDNIILQLSVLNLIAYLIMDCYIGYNKYHKYMCTLSGYTHHIIYIFISFMALTMNLSNFYLLYMIEELPTFFLSLGSYDSILRNDNLFGLTFFITRILYHIYLTWIFKSKPLFLILGILALSVHIYWFKNWIEKYFLNKNQSCEKSKVKGSKVKGSKLKGSKLKGLNIQRVKNSKIKTKKNKFKIKTNK
jgi:hypothetical protein